MVWEDGYDTLADTYKPKDGFRIPVNGSRLASLRRVLGYTANVIRYRADGKLYILKPTMDGEVYNSEYGLESGHTFFAKAYRKTLVIPNRIVVKSNPNDDPSYSDEATDPESYALIPKTQYRRGRLQSKAEAKDIAEATIFNLKLNAQMGAAEVPINVGQELFDYVKVNALNAQDVYRAGNIGSIVKIYNAEKQIYNMRFSFGNPPTIQRVRELTEAIEKQKEDEGVYFDRLYAQDAYIENLSIDQIIAVWLDPDSNIDLSLIGDTLDSLLDGEVYARVKSLHITAGNIYLDENILYKADYDPTEKFDLGDDTLDDISEGITYQRVLATHISAGKIKLTSETVIDGLWYSQSGVDIDANQGINIYGVANALTTRATKTGAIQCYVGADGKIYAGAGSVYLDSMGITILGERLRFFYGATNVGFIKASTSTALLISAGSIRKVQIIGGLGIELLDDTKVGGDMLPLGDGRKLGGDDATWEDGWIDCVYTTLVYPQVSQEGYIGTSLLFFNEMHAKDFIPHSPRPIEGALNKLKGVKLIAGEYDKASFPTEVFRPGDATDERNELLQRAERRAGNLEKRAESSTEGQKQALIQKAQKTRREAQEQADKLIPHDGLSLPGWCSLLHGGLMELLDRVEALKVGD